MLSYLTWYGPFPNSGCGWVVSCREKTHLIKPNFQTYSIPYYYSLDEVYCTLPSKSGDVPYRQSPSFCCFLIKLYSIHTSVHFLWFVVVLLPWRVWKFPISNQQAASKWHIYTRFATAVRTWNEGKRYFLAKICYNSGTWGLTDFFKVSALQSALRRVDLCT